LSNKLDATIDRVPVSADSCKAPTGLLVQCSLKQNNAKPGY